MHPKARPETAQVAEAGLPSAGTAPQLPTRVVVFMSAPSADDIPDNGAQPASLLPFGCATFAEQVLDSCARAGLKSVDLVISEQPEALRAHLGDGWRWGLTLNWHLAKESGTPYGLLHAMGWAPGQRLLIGHGDRWVSDTVIRALIESNRVALRVGQGVEWSGWASLDSSFQNDIPAHADFNLLGTIMVGQISTGSLMVAPDQFACAGSAADLLRAQSLAWGEQRSQHVPATWIRRPWGAMSPDASVHEQAEICGPVLIGPRCHVDRGARIGPGAVLSRDVLVSTGAVVSDALVLPETYLSGGVTLEHSVVRGNVVQDLRWSARLTLPLEDGVMGPLTRGGSLRGGWTGRLLALLLALAGLPLAVILHLVQLLQGRPGGWARLDAVRGRHPATGALQQASLRTGRADAGVAGWLLGGYGAVLDVAQGRRRWFGIRPREKAQWYALRRDWQVLFSEQPIGLFHAPAWADPSGQPDGEALAAADAFFIVRASWRERLRVLHGLMRPRNAGVEGHARLPG